MYSILGLLSLLLHQTADAESCLYNAERINTCNGESKAGNRFNIYHTNTLNLTYDTSCSCSITGYQNDLITVAVTNTPRSDNCGSSIHIVKPDATGYFVTCIFSPVTYDISLTTGTTTTIIFKTTARTFSSSAFCIFIEDGGSSNMTIKCGSRTPLLSTSTTTTPSTTKLSVSTSIITTKEQESTTTVIEMTSTRSVTTSNKEETFATKKETVESTTADDSDELITTSGDETMSYPSQELPLQIIIPVAGGGSLLVLIVIISVTCVRCRKQKSNEDIVKSDGKNNLIYNIQYICDQTQVIQDEDDNEMRINSLYESSDDIQLDINATSIDDVSGGYSEVKNLSRRKPEYSEGNYSGIETSSQFTRRSRYNDYTDIDLPSDETQRPADVIGNSFEFKNASQINVEVANGNKPINSEERDFPVYALPNKALQKKSEFEKNTEEGPVYAYPVKKKKPESRGQASKTGGTKPIIKPILMPKPTKQQPYVKNIDITNADGVLYSDIQVPDNGSGD